MEKMSLYDRYKEASCADIINKVVIPLLAEFFAMVMHTFWGSMYVIPRDISIQTGYQNITNCPNDNNQLMIGTLVPAFQAGFAVWMFIVLFWKICVINFNPAISTCLLISGDLSPWLYLPYIGMQIMGSALGAIIAQRIKGDDIGPFLIADDANISAILACEVVTTGIMCFFTNVMVGDKKYDQSTGPLAIGITVFQGILAGRWVGAGGLNPARAVGPAIVLGGKAWNYHWVWWVGDLLGAIVFAVIYRAFFAVSDKVWILKIGNKIANSRSSVSSRDEVYEDDEAIKGTP